MSTWGCRWEENQVQYYELKDSDLSVHATVSSRPNVLNKMFPLIGEYCFLCSTLWLGGSVRPMVRHSVSNRARAIALLQNIGGLHCDSFTEACQRLHATYFLAIYSLFDSHLFVESFLHCILKLLLIFHFGRGGSQNFTEATDPWIFLGFISYLVASVSLLKHLQCFLPLIGSSQHNVAQ